MILTWVDPVTGKVMQQERSYTEEEYERLIARGLSVIRDGEGYIRHPFNNESEHGKG